MKEHIQKTKDLLLNHKTTLKKLFFTLFPFVVVVSVALIGWIDETIFFFKETGEKILQSAYALIPFLIFATVAYFLFYIPGKRLSPPRKKLFTSLGRSLAAILIFVGFNRSLVYWGVQNESLLHAEKALYIFCPFLLSSFLVKFALERWSLNLSLSKKGIFMMLSRILSMLVLVLGVLTALTKMGYDAKVILGSLSIGGLALGLAVKDTISNSICGLLIIIFEPFKVGDYITIFDKQGTVEKIQLKHITVRQDSETVHILPNATVYSQIVSVKQNSETEIETKTEENKNKNNENKTISNKNDTKKDAL